jgi:hypothetical protein
MFCGEFSPFGKIFFQKNNISNIYLFNNNIFEKKIKIAMFLHIVQTNI